MKSINCLKVLLVALFMSASALLVAQSPVAVRWEMGENGAEKGYYSSRFIFKNISAETLTDNWCFFFNQFSRPVKVQSGCPVNVEQINTTYYRVTPNSDYRALAPGDSMIVDMLMRGTYVNVCYSPMGGHFVTNDDAGHPIPVKIEYDELDDPKQWIARNDYPEGSVVYRFNETLKNGETPDHSYNIFPTPKNVKINQGFVRFGNIVSIKGGLLDFKLRDERKFLAQELKRRGIYISDGQHVLIRLKESKKLHSNPEYYELTVNDSVISIVGTSKNGVLNGVKTLLAAIDHSKNNCLENAVVKDYPDFHYRGMMLDIARNFTTFDNLKRFIDILAYYKLNIFQFHFTDDEAWRLEIPGLPELTNYASRRGCTLDERDFMAQIFDGTGNPDDLAQSANGYLTRTQFVDLLKYAHERGVKVIPEIETPGHARAAIMAMKARYNKYKDVDKMLAEQYRLWDDADESEYSSAQAYKDNVLDVSQDGVYNFLSKVIGEMQAMYKEAGLKLDVVHLGGDEVASGAWSKSPNIQSLMKRENLKNAHEVHEYYIRRMSDILYSKHILIQGWQEVGLNHTKVYDAQVAPRFAGVNAWSTIGSKISVPYELANAGYPTILSNVTNFYIDMAYSWHQYEKGLHWGGAVDEYASWSAQPLDIYRTARCDYNGNPIDLQRVAQGKIVLTKPENIIGIVGPLWTETIRNFNQVMSYTLPKVLGLAERAWTPAVEWNDNEVGDFERARAAYNAKIGLVELPVMQRKGWNFHLGQPGINVENGMLFANAQYAGEVVRYTLDGSEPTMTSPIWIAPVAVGKTTLVKAKAYYLGRESVTSYLWLK